MAKVRGERDPSLGIFASTGSHNAMAKYQEISKKLIDGLRGSAKLSRHGDEHKGLDKWVFGVAGAIAVAFVAWGIIDATGLGRASSTALDYVMKNFGWFFVIAATVFLLFILVVAFSRFGRIPLGQDNDVPQFKTLSWISMMFAAGMGIGLMFYGVAEPLFFYVSPPPDTVSPETADAVSTALGTALFHWTLYPWAMYAIVGLGLAYGSYRLGRSQLFSSLFAGLLGEKAVNGVGGRIINILAIVATLFGSACSLGLGALQIGGGLVHGDMVETASTSLFVIIIVVLTVCFMASAISGIERGIQWLSNINMVLAVALALIVFVAGPTLFILNVFPNSLGTFLADLPHMASRTAGVGSSDLSEWMSSWTIFYWAWWVSWSPFVGLFIGRISKGRTIRQFVTGVLLAPSAVSVLWFAIFGGGAIGTLQRARATGAASSTVQEGPGGEPVVDSDTVLFQFLDDLAFPGWISGALMVLCIVLIAIFFITGADSASIVMAGLTENGTEEPKRWNVVFWGLATGGTAAIMLVAGGDDPATALQGLQNITIVTAVPFVLVLVFLCFSIWRDLSRDPLMIQGALAKEVLEQSVVEGVGRHKGEAFALNTHEYSPDEAIELQEIFDDDDRRAITDSAD
ncbi:MAG: BCCT family transporter [Ancrocorticia sp.]|uniref:BCCT family transporter n=2 Tax=Ancrocorticia sp. TaxID=2593684 RepID=UPI003F8F01AF